MKIKVFPIFYTYFYINILKRKFLFLGYKSFKLKTKAEIK